MVTLVGTQKNFAEAIKELIELDFDAAEAYQAAIKRLDSQAYKTQMDKFLQDHLRHVAELSGILRTHNEEPPAGPSAMKQWLTKGKVVIADLAGDRAILLAMHSNEKDTNTAYQRMNERDDIWEDARPVLMRGLRDEQHHKEWIEDALK